MHRGCTRRRSACHRSNTKAVLAGLDAGSKWLLSRRSHRNGNGDPREQHRARPPFRGDRSDGVGSGGRASPRAPSSSGGQIRRSRIRGACEPASPVFQRGTDPTESDQGGVRAREPRLPAGDRSDGVGSGGRASPRAPSSRALRSSAVPPPEGRTERTGEMVNIVGTLTEIDFDRPPTLARSIG